MRIIIQQYEGSHWKDNTNPAAGLETNWLKPEDINIGEVVEMSDSHYGFRIVAVYTT